MIHFLNRYVFVLINRSFSLVDNLNGIDPYMELYVLWSFLFEENAQNRILQAFHFCKIFMTPSNSINNSTYTSI